jgi:hypothetical protein
VYEDPDYEDFLDLDDDADWDDFDLSDLPSNIGSKEIHITVDNQTESQL